MHFYRLLLPIESQDQFEFFIEITSTPKTKSIQPAASTPVKKPSSSSSSSSSSSTKHNHTRTSIRPRRTLKRTYCKSAIFFRQLKRTFL